MMEALLQLHSLIHVINTVKFAHLAIVIVS